mmetsp:Transcript_30003/g.69773  ORF Transcript_30003/g.69773 Transcript_30003/m.69773 type:complete len:210 (-) Transcript_30003:279-908(-)
MDLRHSAGKCSPERWQWHQLCATRSRSGRRPCTPHPCIRPCPRTVPCIHQSMRHPTPRNSKRGCRSRSHRGMRDLLPHQQARNEGTRVAGTASTCAPQPTQWCRCLRLASRPRSACCSRDAQCQCNRRQQHTATCIHRWTRLLSPPCSSWPGHRSRPHPGRRGRHRHPLAGTCPLRRKSLRGQCTLAVLHHQPRTSSPTTRTASRDCPW